MGFCINRIAPAAARMCGHKFGKDGGDGRCVVIGLDLGIACHENNLIEFRCYKKKSARRRFYAGEVP